MTMHSIHPDTHTHGLADDCERCAEHAADPLRGLDDENLTRLIHAAVDRSIPPLTYTDAVASASILTTLEHAGHLYRTAPDLVGEFFSRWVRV